MPEENVEQQAPAAAPDSAAGNTPTPEPEPEIRFASADTIDQPDPGAAPDDTSEASGQVPSFRLREESARRREAEQALQLVQQQNQLLAQQMQQQQQIQQQAPAADTDNPVDEIRRPFGEDHDGQQAYQAVRGVSEHVARETVEGLRSEIRSELQNEFDTKLGSVTASMQMAEELAGMKVRGLIDDTAEKEIGRRMGDAMRQNPAWGQQTNQRHLLNQVWTDMLRSGEIKPTTRPATPNGGGTNPLQPGAPRLTEQQLRDNNDAQLRDIQQRFPRQFGKMSIEALRDLGGTMAGPQDQPQVGQPVTEMQQTQPAFQRTFVHTRDEG